MSRNYHPDGRDGWGHNRWQLALARNNIHERDSRLNSPLSFTLSHLSKINISLLHNIYCIQPNSLKF